LLQPVVLAQPPGSWIRLAAAVVAHDHANAAQVQQGHGEPAAEAGVGHQRVARLKVVRELAAKVALVVAESPAGLAIFLVESMVMRLS